MVPRGNPKDRKIATIVGVVFAVLVIIAEIAGGHSHAATAKAARSPVDEANEQREKLRDDLVTSAHVKLYIARRLMPDPTSFQIASAFQMIDGAVCLKYRARNGLGGMEIGSAVFAKEALYFEGQSGFHRTWKNECEGSALAEREVTDDLQMVEGSMVERMLELNK